MKRTMKLATAMLSLLFAALCMGGCFASPDANTAPPVSVVPTAEPTAHAHGRLPFPRPPLSLRPFQRLHQIRCITNAA